MSDVVALCLPCYRNNSMLDRWLHRMKAGISSSRPANARRTFAAGWLQHNSSFKDDCCDNPVSGLSAACQEGSRKVPLGTVKKNMKSLCAVVST